MLNSVLVGHQNIFCKKSLQRLHCSEQVFVHSDGTRCQWIQYSVSQNALYCLPCLVFSDATLRSEHWRANQGNAFTDKEFCNWKKQCSAILKRDSSCVHRNAIVSQFMQDETILQALTRADVFEMLANKQLLLRMEECWNLLSTF